MKVISSGLSVVTGRSGRLLGFAPSMREIGRELYTSLNPVRTVRPVDLPQARLPKPDELEVFADGSVDGGRR
jgi:hypothetical protein